MIQKDIWDNTSKGTNQKVVFRKINEDWVGRFPKRDQKESKPMISVPLYGTICYGWVGINFVPQPQTQPNI